MCDAWSLTLVLATVVATASVISLFVLAGRFQGRMQTSHAATWRWLTTWKFRFIDSEPGEAAIPEFVWSGMYKNLNDNVLNRIAVRMKVLTVLAVVCLGAVMLISWITPASRLMNCLASGKPS